MDDKFPTHWLEEIIDELLSKDLPLYTLATGKTPSGHIHLGILREIIICDAIRRILENKGKNVRSLLFFDSFDAAKRFPSYIRREFQQDHLGKPFFLIPCPFEDCNCESYAFHFGNELRSTFKDFGIKNEIIWTHELYKTEEMYEKIKIALEKTDQIKKILRKYILPTLDDEKKDLFVEMQKTWMPVMVVCEECNRIQFVDKKDGSIKPNRIISYDSESETVLYQCNTCGYKDHISINSGRLKLNWRVDWPAKWTIFNTTCEPAGKDHCVKGGAYDTGLELCNSIFGYDGPIRIPYEWLRLGDRDMKTSKGIVFTPKKYIELADPEIFRMLILRTNPMKHISLRIEEIPQYYDYYEKIEDIYYDIQEADSKEEKENAEYIYPLIKVDSIPKCKPKRIPYKLITFLAQVQNILTPKKLYKKAKETSEIEISEFNKLLIRTDKWLDEIKKILENTENEKDKRNLLQKITIFSVLKELDEDITIKLSEDQKGAISLLREFLKNNENLDEDVIQNKIFSIAKEDLGISPKELFQALYQILLGKKFGPRLGSFLSLLDKEWLIERLDF